MAIGIPALRIIAIALVFTTATQLLSGFLQVMGQGSTGFTAAISQAVVLLLGAWLLAQSGSVTLVWLAFPIMETIRFMIAALTVGRTCRGKLAALRPQAA